MGDKSEKQKFLSDLLDCIREGKKFYYTEAHNVGEVDIVHATREHKVDMNKTRKLFDFINESEEFVFTKKVRQKFFSDNKNNIEVTQW